MTAARSFELIRDETLPEINSRAQLYRHAKTGAEVLSLVNDDENKVFGINFRTPPTDSTGVAHILEHSVLCGSRKYPVKDPFVQLMKGSLNTFLNAMTYPDKTCYPVASQNLRDFYNLVDVYLDAVFYPRITENILEQEGWHYELESADKPLIYKGVVFNEMKGNYSSPDGILADWSQRSLFPDTTYGLDSGGDPKHIPDLTYADFKHFHERYYHPSNARIVFYGDDDPAERLRLLDEYLSAFEPIVVSSAVDLQTRFEAPRSITRTYPAGAAEPGEKRAMVTVNWMLGEAPDTETKLALGILDHVLLGNAAAPLHKALIDSGLGGSTAGHGLDSGLRQMMFSIGLKDIDPDDASKVEALVFDTLRDLATNGIDPLTIAAAINTVEFSLRENNTGSFPRGISIMLRSLSDWLYERDPLAPLSFEAPLAAVKGKASNGGRLFETLIERYFLDNNHRSTVLLKPDALQGERDTAVETARLAAVRGAMSEADLAAVVARTQKLKELQELPDTPEALASIPMLTLADLPRENKQTPIEHLALRETPVLWHDLFTAGIVYLDLAFDLHTLPPDLLPYVDLFGRALFETGAGEDDFVGLSQRIGSTTGGIRPRVWISAVEDAPGAAARLILRGKATTANVGALLAILEDVLTTARLDDRDRLKQMALEDKAGFESALVPRGSMFAARRLRAGFNEAGWADEQTSGVAYLSFLRDLTSDFDARWPQMHGALERIRALLVNRAVMLCNVTCDAATWRQVQPQLEGFLGNLPHAACERAHWPAPRHEGHEGLTLPTMVNYVAKGLDLHALGYRSNGSAAVIGHHLGADWLWQKVRVQGGAYGAQGGFSRLSGLFVFSSYRDPNLLETIDIFDGAADFLKRSDLSDTELTRCIIGAIGDIDQYQLPDAKGFSSMVQYLIGQSDERLQHIREGVLGTTMADFHRLGDALAQGIEAAHVVVLGSEEAIAKANAKRQGFLSTTKVL